MRKQHFTTERDGFCGTYYPVRISSGKAMIAMLGNSSEGRMVQSAARWLHERGCNVLALSPGTEDGGYHDIPLERFGKAIAFLKSRGCEKIGIVGASTTGMMALLAASLCPEITLTIAFTPPDFIMEGFFRGRRDGAPEWPSGGSSVTWKGQPLPYLPYACRHPEYWRRIMADSKASGNRIASRPLFEESERRHPVRETEKIKVENIRGRLILVGAEDDALWDTCKYIRRMVKRLEGHPHACEVEVLLYEHGTHFVFPQSMLKIMLPVGSELLIRLMFKAGREAPAACRRTRIDIDEKLTHSILTW